MEASGERGRERSYETNGTTKKHFSNAMRAELLDELKILAVREETSISALLEEAVEELLDSRGHGAGQ